MKQTKSWILAHPEAGLRAVEWSSYQKFCKAYLQGIALPHILGSWEFYGRSFVVSEDVLIPRPETELMIEHGIMFLNEFGGKDQVADIGTGSGCVGVTLALEAPWVRVIGTDLSLPAITVARENATKFHVGKRMAFVQADLLISVHTKFDLICANMPYIPTMELNELDLNEPQIALDGGLDGLQLIHRLIHNIHRWLSHGGRALLEFGAGQAESIIAVIEESNWKDVQIYQDLAGIDRLVSLHRSEKRT